MAVTGRALVVAPYGAVLNDGVQLTGPMVIFSFSDIVVGQGAVLKKVLLFTPKRLIVGDYSQIDGIMAAGRSVTWGKARATGGMNPSLPPTGHPISFRRRLPYDWKEMDVGPFLRSPLGSASGRLCFWPYDSCRRSTFGGIGPLY